MVLDPVSAVGLAGSVVQFVSFTTGLLSKGNEIYHSADGAVIENLELEMITRNLAGLLSQLSTPLKDDPSEDSSTDSATEMDSLRLKDLSDSCGSAARDLLDTLEDIKLKGSHRKWRSLRQALRTSWSNEKIDGLVRRISRYREELSFNLILAIR